MPLRSKLSAEIAGILMPRPESNKDWKSVTAQKARLRLASVDAAMVPQSRVGMERAGNVQRTPVAARMGRSRPPCGWNAVLHGPRDGGAKCGGRENLSHCRNSRCTGPTG